MRRNLIENLTGKDAAEKIKEMTESIRTCLMMTALDKRPFSVRPMAIQKTNDEGLIYFFSRADSDKNSELLISPEMHLAFSNDSSSEYLSLYGNAEVYREQDEINEMYSASANAWFDGKTDPNLTIIRFTPEKAHYWDIRHGKIIELAGMVVEVTGNQTNNGLQGDLKL